MTVSDQEITFTARTAFPNVNLPMIMGPIAVLTPTLNTLAANAKAAAATAAAAEQPPAAQAPGGSMSGRPGGMIPQGGRRGGR